MTPIWYQRLDFFYVSHKHWCFLSIQILTIKFYGFHYILDEIYILYYIKFISDIDQISRYLLVYNKKFK